MKKGYDIIALEISDISIPSERIALDKKAVVLIIGNEQFGISDEILALTSKHMHIEMYGENSSMNVVQATGIALYTLVNKLVVSD
jgi:tRNA G18 (ribose-2'-O)-methylase SpoU